MQEDGWLVLRDKIFISEVFSVPFGTVFFLKETFSFLKELVSGEVFSENDIKTLIKKDFSSSLKKDKLENTLSHLEKWLAFIESKPTKKTSYSKGFSVNIGGYSKSNVRTKFKTVKDFFCHSYDCKTHNGNSVFTIEFKDEQIDSFLNGLFDEKIEKKIQEELDCKKKSLSSGFFLIDKFLTKIDVNWTVYRLLSDMDEWFWDKKMSSFGIKKSDLDGSCCYSFEILKESKQKRTINNSKSKANLNQLVEGQCQLIDLNSKVDWKILGTYLKDLNKYLEALPETQKDIFVKNKILISKVSAALSLGFSKLKFSEVKGANFFAKENTINQNNGVGFALYVEEPNRSAKGFWTGTGLGLSLNNIKIYENEKQAKTVIKRKLWKCNVAIIRVQSSAIKVEEIIGNLDSNELKNFFSKKESHELSLIVDKNVAQKEAEKKQKSLSNYLKLCESHLIKLGVDLNALKKEALKKEDDDCAAINGDNAAIFDITSDDDIAALQTSVPQRSARKRL